MVILKISPRLAYVTALPCETLVSAKRANNDKLQGNVAAYWKFGGVVNNQIRKGFLLSLSVILLSPRKRGIMESPALVCLFVCLLPR